MNTFKTKKIKLFFGLIYLKIKGETTEWELRLFGIRIFKSRVRNLLRSKEIVYFLGYIPIFYHSILKRLTYNYMQNIIKKYPSFDNYIVFSSGCGEIFWAFAHLKEYIEQKNIKNPLIICERNILKNIYKMFKNLNYPVVVEKNCSGLLLNDENIINNKRFLVPLNYKYFGKNEKNIIKNGTHYYIELKKQLGVKENPILDINNIESDIKNKIKYLAEGILKNKFVIIMPEARTIKELEKDFWNELVKKFKNEGYEVFYNCSFIGSSIDGTVTMFLSFNEFVELTKYSSAIIGLRNGFLEVLSVLSQKPTLVIYNKFNQYAQNELNSEQARNGFSTLKLPTINSNITKEYLYENISLIEIYNDFISLANINKQNCCEANQEIKQEEL